MKLLEEIKSYLDNAESRGRIDSTTRKAVEQLFNEYGNKIIDLEKKVEANQGKSDIQNLISRTLYCFPKSFINHRYELILEPKNNLYFRLEDVDDDFSYKAKMLAWLSRPISKGLTNAWSTKVLNSLNEFLGTKFTKDEMRIIYQCLGYDSNRELAVKFIKNDYDLNLLTK